MLAKVITLAHSRGANGFGPVLRYLLRAEQRKDSPIPESGHLHLAQEPFWSAAEDPREYAQDLAQVFDEQARHCRGRGRFTGNPFYHVAISWVEGEHPTPQQAERVSRHVMQALGFGECQAVFAIHRDTENDHVHLVVNRVHPTKLTAISVPLGDYFVLDRCMRELELELGFARTHGPHITIDTADGPKIVRMSRTEREARGLLQDGNGPRLSPRARRAEQNLAALSFQRWLTGTPGSALHRAVTWRTASWQDGHEIFAGFGCAIRPRGSGMVVTTTLSNGRVLAAKASLLGRWASKASLERVLGPYAEPALGSFRRADPRRSYEHFIERERRAEIRAPGSRDEGQRLVRRAEREQARRQLAERYARGQAQLQRHAGERDSHCGRGRSKSDASSPVRTMSSGGGHASYSGGAGTEASRSLSGPSRRRASAGRYSAARPPSDAP